jgi:hypothetical protein
MIPWGITVANCNVGNCFVTGRAAYQDQHVQSIRTPQTAYKTPASASRRHEMTSRDRASLKYAVEMYRLLLTPAVTRHNAKFYRMATGYDRAFFIKYAFVQIT